MRWLKKLIASLSESSEQFDERVLKEFCSNRPGVIPISQVETRELATVIGQVSVVRVVPQPNGSSWLEANITDGTGMVALLWTGRRSLAGLTPGRRLVASARAVKEDGEDILYFWNPQYELL